MVTDSLVPLVLLEAQIVEVNECWQGWVLSDLRQDSAPGIGEGVGFR